tara:strand:- start:299 stop:568 length:270 start_codon:yes stop_codon:yes gene_type:complete
MSKKFLVIEQHKFNTFKDSWTIKFASVDEDTAFKKLVALNTLNDSEEKIYYIVNMEYLWARDSEDSARSDEPLVLTDEVNNEDKQQKLF